MNPIKVEIEKALNKLELNTALGFMQSYEKEYPQDMDLIVYKSLYNLYRGNIDEALELAWEAVRKYPTNGDLYFNLAAIYEQSGNLLASCKNYIKAHLLYGYTDNKNDEILQLEAKINEIRNVIVERIGQCEVSGDYTFIESAEKFSEQLGNLFGMLENSYRGRKQIVGNYYWVTEDEKRYIGVYRKPLLLMIDGEWDLINTKGEFLKVSEGTNFTVLGNAEEYFLPIAVEENNTEHTFEKDGVKLAAILQHNRKHFNYYRVKNKTSIHSDNKAFYGEVIPLGIDPKKKKLVLNIFLDGLSQEVINGKDFEELMPYTYRFFKKGVVCTQTYAASEWTYPSIANYVTGVDVTHHMLFHNQIDIPMPKDIPTLPEYFKEAGYFTCMMNGDWRIIPTYGHARGYDQYIYQHQCIGFKAEMMIGEVIDHLEAFQETNQFLWMTIGDLHDIADDLDLPIAIQGRTEMEEWQVDVNDTTSAKQKYDKNKISIYKKMVSHIDVLLGSLYKYIEERYQDQEIIVSLFSDHGQSYLVPTGEHFMCRERSNVAFMLRGCQMSAVTDEIISSSDYLNIMCKLAGISMKNIKTDGQLPVTFGGMNEREYALSESLHPKDPYYATFFTKKFTIYFENGSPTEDDGRFELKDYTISAKDIKGNVIRDPKLLDKYFKIVLEHIAHLLIY